MTTKPVSKPQNIFKINLKNGFIHNFHIINQNYYKIIYTVFFYLLKYQVSTKVMGTFSVKLDIPEESR